MNNITDAVTLHNGVKMPRLGFGVYQVEDGRQVEQSVLSALRAGYRSIDTAEAYFNEDGVGRAIRASGVPREDLFVTTKVWNTNQGYETTLQAFENSRKRLGLEYIDLYLIHWPARGKYLEAWRAFEKLYREGYVRAIGVCNCHEQHLNAIMQNYETVPMVNQVELHPLLSQERLRAFCRDNGIQIEAWAPLIRGQLNIPLLWELGRKYGKTSAQIILRWDLQHGIVTIPKSVHDSRIRENADVFDFELTGEDMKAIDALNRNARWGPDPDNFNF
ncbi:Aldo/keto reductase [Paenibacillus sophorae]|uniref:Aldo/keto reductase n=1 Tax=Paenibacillus sophorae TaxID=1333845 RepID=A0A1H8P7Q1_9BACL|nr:aldo/keto reductase [Paenibacillus sophorae]QWU16469.1 aldo/keto reductase [Paenibacillus sophorae]SEO37965.1 Aldo/keto reductase [Paenibacillus sophorae]